jgi:hypothetical protein
VLERCTVSTDTLSAQPIFLDKYIIYSRLLMPSRPHALAATNALRVLLIGENVIRRGKPIGCHVKIFIIATKAEILYVAAYSKK